VARRAIGWSFSPLAGAGESLLRTDATRPCSSPGGAGGGLRISSAEVRGDGVGTVNVKCSDGGEGAVRGSRHGRGARAARLREENRKLKQLVAGLSLDKTILREALGKKF
jgi:hypothetical protein